MATYEVETSAILNFKEDKFIVNKEFTKYIFKSKRSKEYKNKYNLFFNSCDFEEYEEYRNFKKVYIIRHCSRWNGELID
jgi:hypothetical protein